MVRHSRLLLLLTAVVAAPALAQTPDTTTAARYVPLAVGNEWHTSESYNAGYPGGDYSEVERVVVVGEDPAFPGRFLTEWTRRRSGPTGSSTTNGTGALRYDAATQRVEGDNTPCPLGAPFGAPAACVAGAYAVTGGYGQSVAVGSQSVVTSRKQFRREVSSPSGFFSERYVFAAGLGAVEYQMQQVTGPDQSSRSRTLQFARIGGTEYGTRLFPVAGESAPAEAALSLTVGPNPSSGAAALRYTLAVPGAVRLSIVDVLGREVAIVADGEQAAGDHVAALDTRRLAAGLYVARLTDGRALATAALTVAP